MVSNDTLIKLKTLAERGVDGEKENAAALLQKLCEKNNISLDQLESEDLKFRWFKYPRDAQFRKLITQCIYKTMGPGFKAYTIDRKNQVGVECTPAQAIEIQLDYEFYAKHLKNELSRMVSAFIDANHIFPPNAPKGDGSGFDEKDIYLIRGIERRTRVQQIAQNGNSTQEGLC